MIKSLIIVLTAVLFTGAATAGEFQLRNNSGTVLVVKVPSQFLPEGWSSYQKTLPLGAVEFIELPNHFTVSVQPIALGYSHQVFEVPANNRVNTHYWGSAFDLKHSASSYPLPRY